MARAIWKGAIAFGLVNIPVNLHAAIRDSRPHFRMLHGKDRSPVRFERVCRKEGRPVRWDDLVKGYEYQKGKFVVLTKADFQAAALEKSRTIDILHFVDAQEIDRRFFETPYYLTPNNGAERAYALLREAVRESGKVGIAKIIIRENQHLAALTAHEKALVLTTMRLADELIEIADVDSRGLRNVRPQELAMAKSLVESLTEPWKPNRYTDEYRANLMRIIRAKVKGTAPRLQEPEAGAKEAEVVDLMARLRQSLETRQNPRVKRPSPRAKHAKTPHKASRRVA